MGVPADVGELLQALPVPMWVYDAESLRILAVNDEAVARYGWSQEEFTALTMVDLAPDRRRPRRSPARGPGPRRSETARRVAGVWRHRRSDGSALDVILRTSPVLYEGRDARLAVVHAMAEASSMSDAVALAEAIVDSSDDAVVSMSAEGTIQSWNPGAERIYGYGEAEMLGRPFEDLEDTDGRSETASLVSRVVAGEGVVSLETERVRADGSHILVNLTLFPVLDSMGKLIGVSSISRDVSEQHRAIDRDRSLAKLSQRALSDVPLATVLDSAARLVESALGAEVASVLELVPGTDELLLVAGARWARVRIGTTRIPAGSDSVFGRALASATSVVVQFTFDPRDPTRPVAPDEPATRPTVVAPVRIDKRCWGAVAAHFPPRSEPTAAERAFVEGVASAVGAAVARVQRETIRQRSEELSRLAAVGQLAAGVCHDFNNVLTVVQLAAERLRTSEKLSERGLEQLDLLRGQLDHASALLWQILDFARSQQHDARAIDLGGLVESLGGIISTVVGRGVTLAMRIATDPLFVKGDPVRLQQVLMNLVTNARDALGEGGTLVVSVAERTVTSLEADLPAGLEPGTWTCLEVSDSGAGMRPEVLERALDPFFTTKGPGRGTGLGLAQVASLVAKHDGHLGITSVEGSGTTVTVWLPPTSEDAEDDENADLA